MTDTGRGVTSLSEDRELVPTENDAVDAMLAAAGDALAFERLYRRHLARVNSLARRMIGPDDADDATQAVFIRAWEKLGTFRGESAFGTWLHRLAINVMLARRTTLGIERGRFQDSEAAVERMPSRSSHHEFSIDFEGAIEQLPSGAREVFVLHDIEGYKHEEIAGMLGIVTGTSKAQLHRARMALRGYLDR
jgi:RNA polymerase sigma-70 factor (ECF subfamily)